MSFEQKTKIASAHRGKKHPWTTGDRSAMKRPGVRAKISAALRGRKWVVGRYSAMWRPEVRAKVSAALKGRPLSPEHRRKLSDAHRGRKIPPEVAVKIAAANRGKKRSPEVVAKIAAVLRGKKRSSVIRAKISAMNLSRSLEVRAKIGAALRGKKQLKISGPNHWNWKGGASGAERLERRTLRYRVWRDAVYVQDRWKCQSCGKHCQKGDIAADHIVPWREAPHLRYDVLNGRTLCYACHAHRHRSSINGQFFSYCGGVDPGTTGGAFSQNRRSRCFELLDRNISTLF